MDLGLDNKVIVITGGGLGIGFAISLACAREGAIPVIVNRDEPAVRQNLKLLEEERRPFEFVEAWLDSPEICRVVVDEIRARRDGVDGLVNNIGVNDGVGLETGTPAAFMQSLQNNLWHSFSMAHYLLPSLKERRGSIVNIGSKVACTGQGGTSGYAAAKGAQLALTREWAVDLLPYGIRVNAVVPSEVWTPAYQQWISRSADPERERQEISHNIPLGQRMTTPEEIASTVVFLLSDRASHTTGQFLFVDGGYVHLDRVVNQRRPASISDADADADIDADTNIQA